MDVEVESLSKASDSILAPRMHKSPSTHGSSGASRGLVAMLMDLRAKRREAKEASINSLMLARGEGQPSQRNVSQPNVLESKIIRQVEFYFGDYNLPKDRFINSVMEKNSNWMPITTLMTFKRLNSLTKDPDVVLKALEMSRNCLIKVDLQNKRIRRDPKFPPPELNEDRKIELGQRTVFVGGFDKRNTSLDEIIDFFENGYGVVNISKRVTRSDDNESMGSVFVTFATKAASDDFLTKIINFNGRRLVTKSQQDFFATKVEYNDSFDPVSARRTVWIHGFDREVITQDELAEFFSRFKGASLIKKRRLREWCDDYWRFTGSVFVTFDDVKSADSFLSVSQLNFNSDKLKKMSQIEFYKQKKLFLSDIKAL